MTLDTLPASDDYLTYTPPPGYGTQARTADYDGYDNVDIVSPPPARAHRETHSSGSRDRSRSVLPTRAHSHNSNISVDSRSRSQSIVYVSSDPPDSRANNATAMREQNLDIRELKLQSNEIATKLDALRYVIIFYIT